jgi:hypothetical protein
MSFGVALMAEDHCANWFLALGRAPRTHAATEGQARQRTAIGASGLGTQLRTSRAKRGHKLARRSGQPRQSQDAHGHRGHPPSTRVGRHTAKSPAKPGQKRQSPLTPSAQTQITSSMLPGSIRQTERLAAPYTRTFGYACPLGSLSGRKRHVATGPAYPVMCHLSRSQSA